MTKAVEVDVREKVAQRLLDDESPSIRYWTLRDILGRKESDGEAREA